LKQKLDIMLILYIISKLIIPDKISKTTASQALALKKEGLWKGFDKSPILSLRTLFLSH